MKIEFENRLVAFIDVLGWSKATESRSAAELYHVLDPVRQHAEIHNEAVRQQLIANYGDRLNPMALGVQFAFFSDCLVFSMPSNMVGRIYDATSGMIRTLLNSGFAVRGGVTAGQLYHRDQIVFGHALITAYRIESEQAKFARVVVDEFALRETGLSDHDAVIKDHLGNWIVDPFPWIATALDMRNILQQLFDPHRVIEIVREKIRIFSVQPAIRDIWRFQAEVCALSLAKFGDVATDWVAEFRRIAAIDIG